MRKFLVTSAIAVAAVTAIYSCNNGKYDARPDIDYSSGANHLGSDSTGPQVFLGTVEAVINNKQFTLTPAFVYQDGDGVTHLVAQIKNDDLLQRTLRISYTSFQGKRIDTVNAMTSDPVVSMTMVDTGKRDVAGRQLYRTYTANTGSNVGYAAVNIMGNAGGNLHGEMSAKLYRLNLAIGGTPPVYLNDTMSFELSHFYFQKVPFPLTGGYKKVAEQLYRK